MIIDFIHWNVDPEIINIMGYYSLRYYGILFAGGLMLCVFILRWIFKNENISSDRLDTLTIYGMIGIFVGARLGHCLFYDPSYYFSHPVEMLLPIQLIDGEYKFTGYLGLASHGGAAGLIIALILYSRKTHESIINTVDLIGVVAPLGSCFIRLANLMNSEILGFPTDVPWAFIFEREDNLPRHPAQLYEAISYLLIFLLIFYLYKTNRTKLQNGFFFGLSISLIFTARFFIEFVKVRQVSFEEQMRLDMGQLLSIPFILVGVGFVIYGLMKTKKDNQELLTTVD